MFPIRKILCPFDSKTTSREALCQASELARACKAQLAVLYVVPSSEFSQDGSPFLGFVAPPSPFYEQQLSGNARHALERSLREVLPPGVAEQAQTLIRVGPIGEEIVDAARDEGCDLIVMEPHQAPGWSGHPFGSTCESVLRQAPVPVWLARPATSARLAPALAPGARVPEGAHEQGEHPTPMLSIRKILCPTDGSEPSREALQVAGELASQFHAELCVLHVHEPLEPVLGIIDEAEFDADYKEEARQLVREAVQNRVDKGVSLRILVRTGSPAPEILRAAEEERPDLLVIATRGHSGWKKLWLGSVAEPVARLASCPVLTIHEKKEQPKPATGAARILREVAPAPARHLSDVWQVRESDFPRRGTPQEQVRFCLRYAILAPSNRNTQPWLWKIEGDTVELYADFSRALPVVDPQGRELFMAGGAALFNLRVALRHFGLSAEVRLLPDPNAPDLLARVQVVPASPIAVGHGKPRENENDRLFAAITRRRTVRGPFEERPLPVDLHLHLKEAARDEGSFLRFVEKDKRARVADFVEHAGAALARDPAFGREWATWIHDDATRADGVTRAALRLHNGDDAGSYQTGLIRAARDGAAVENAPTLVLLETERDTPGDWLAAGQALERVLLLACADGVFASYYNQPVEVTQVWRSLRSELGLLCHPQLLFRLGFPTSPQNAPPPPRRPVEEVEVSDLRPARELGRFAFQQADRMRL